MDNYKNHALFFMPQEIQKVTVHKNKLHTILRELVLLENSMVKDNSNHLLDVKKLVERLQVLIMFSTEN